MEKKRILVVDDDEAVRRLLSSVLEKCNFDVETANNGREGVTQAMTGSYDLILIDLHMPRMTGAEAIAQLRSSPRTAHLPVVVLSANATRENVIEANRAGADDFVAKNCFKLEPFLERIESALKKSKERTEELPPWLNETFAKLGIDPGEAVSGNTEEGAENGTPEGAEAAEPPAPTEEPQTQAS